MSKNESLTREEMLELHLNPDCLFCSDRLPDHPVDARYGDDRVTRSKAGLVTMFFGYYTPSQVVAREAVGKELARRFAEKMGDGVFPLSKFLQEFCPSGADELLHTLAKEYHERTEAYDRTVCTGPIKDGSIQPVGVHELANICRHANLVRKELEERAARTLGLGPAALREAICRYDR
jgi:hypothetical protein